MAEQIEQAARTAGRTFNISLAELAGANAGQRNDLLALNQAVYRVPDGTLYTSDGSQLVPAQGLPVMANTNPLTGGLELTAGGEVVEVGGGGGVTPALLQSVRAIDNKDSWSAHSLVFTNTTAATTSVYWPWVIETSRIAGALGKYYLYFSTDHDAGEGGIYMAHSNSIDGPWTQYGRVYVDLSGSQQTETPSVIWDGYANRYSLFYQNTGAKYGPSDTLTARGGQGTLMAYSTDGISWTKDPNFVVEPTSFNNQIGDGHTGYFLPFKTKRGLFAYSLYGGTDSFGCVLWNCMGTHGGKNNASVISNDWVSSRALLGYCSDQTYNVDTGAFGAATVPRYVNWNHSFVVESAGTEYLVCLVGLLVSGDTPKTARIMIAPISADYRSLLAQPKTIWSPTESWETGDLRSICPFVDSGKLYIFYTVNKNEIGVMSYVI